MRGLLTALGIIYIIYGAGKLFISLFLSVSFISMIGLLNELDSEEPVTKSVQHATFEFEAGQSGGRDVYSHSKRLEELSENSKNELLAENSQEVKTKNKKDEARKNLNESVSSIVSIVLLLQVAYGILISLLSIVNGILLLKRKGKIFSIVIGCLNILSFPCGSILGILAIVVLCNGETQKLYPEND
ncbi:hypothetical protein AAEX28_10455 [Lentisphaerota bacterium WC36G]|nr:hypothetical protein LJT99_13300 [Lentisphaerae bacterium WC36]